MVGRIGAVAFSILIAACAAGPALPDVAGKPALDLTETGQTSGDGSNTRFARSVAARYAGGASADEIMQDLIGQGFSCDDAASYCTLSVMDGVCADAWTVDFSAGGTPSGTLVRRCMGAMVDEE